MEQRDGPENIASGWREFMSYMGRNPFLCENNQSALDRKIAAPSQRVLGLMALESANGPAAMKMLLAASLFLASLSGCATSRRTDLNVASSENLPTSDQISSERALNSSDANAEYETPQVVDAQKEILASLNEGSLGVEQIRTATGVQYILTTNAPVAEFEAFPITKPSRFVIDLKGVSAKGSSNIQVPADTGVQGIRIGSKAGATRIVFDLTADAAGEQIPTVEKLTDGSGIAVTFGTTESLAAVNRRVVDTSADQVAANNQVQNAELEKTTPVVETRAALAGLNFEKSPNDAGKIALQLTGQPEFALTQSGPTEFVLTLRNSTAGEATLTPQIAQPGKVTGLRVVRAVQKGTDVEVRMFVDAGTELRANKTSSGLTVLAKQGISKSDLTSNETARDARAQLAQEAAAPKEEAAKIVETNDDTARHNPTGISSVDGAKNYTGRLISLDLQETDIDNALRIIAEVSNLNIIASDDVTGKVTLRLIDVPWDQALDVILKTNGLDQVTEGNVIRIAPVDKLRQEREALREAKKAAENLEELSVKYIRVSYARATDLKEQVESVLSERGSATVDERTNQLIVKDIKKGQEEILQLIKKLDLRTPQVLLETQIVEASRNLLRDLGFQWNFSYSMSAQTGNPTGLNFPNSVVVGGAASSASGLQAINFPAAIASDSGSAIAAILDSADGSRALAMRLTALEREGKVRVLSRPQVATVNNKEAEVKSVETVRIPLPDSGLAVATGQGANAAGGGAAAFQSFDVGITLRVTPQASPDYYVLLDVYANSSTFSGNAVQNIPSTLERQTTSTILVKSGQTFALGGVYRINDRETIDGLPFLKDIPVLGTFFRRSFTDKRDEELIFFITPHIVEGSFDPSLM